MFGVMGSLTENNAIELANQSSHCNLLTTKTSPDSYNTVTFSSVSVNKCTLLSSPAHAIKGTAKWLNKRQCH